MDTVTIHGLPDAMMLNSSSELAISTASGDTRLTTKLTLDALASHINSLNRDTQVVGDWTPSIQFWYFNDSFQRVNYTPVGLVTNKAVGKFIKTGKQISIFFDIYISTLGTLLGDSAKRYVDFGGLPYVINSPNSEGVVFSKGVDEELFIQDYVDFSKLTARQAGAVLTGVDMRVMYNMFNINTHFKTPTGGSGALDILQSLPDGMTSLAVTGGMVYETT